MRRAEEICRRILGHDLFSLFCICVGFVLGVGFYCWYVYTGTSVLMDSGYIDAVSAVDVTYPESFVYASGLMFITSVIGIAALFETVVRLLLRFAAFVFGKLADSREGQ